MCVEPIDTKLVRSCDRCDRNPSLSPDPLKHKSSLDVVKHIIRHEGARAFWRGAGTNVINGVVGGLFLAVADEAKKWIR